MLKQLNVIIISPSSYDDGGRLLQYQYILMKSPAPKVLESLVRIAASVRGVLCDVSFVEERLEIGESYIGAIRRLPMPSSLIFITARTYELARAIDIARRMKGFGYTVVIGGPGVTLADWKTYDYMVRYGIVFNVGEGEITVGRIVEDFLNGGLKPFYWQKEYVDISIAPLPALSGPHEHERCLNPMVGINTSEGCPFKCSYCCVIKLRGGNVNACRARNPEAVLDWVEQTHRNGHRIILGDDNFRRSFHYETLKKGLIRLNESVKKTTGRPLDIFIQIDSAGGIEKEMRDLAKAGITHVFTGMESLDSGALKDMNKQHNKPERYQEIASQWRQHGVLVNSGVMLGFPTQTRKEIKEQVMGFNRILDLTSLFCVTPLPGSRDYEDAVKDESLLTFDPNEYDLRHVCRDWFEKMSPKEAQDAFHQAPFWVTSVRYRIGRGRSVGQLIRNVKNNAYGKLMAYWGTLDPNRRYPYLFMMDGIPRYAGIMRPNDGFRGFPLTVDDLVRKVPYLESL